MINFEQKGQGVLGVSRWNYRDQRLLNMNSIHSSSTLPHPNPSKHVTLQCGSRGTWQRGRVVLIWCSLLHASQIAKEDAILPVALFPSLCELVFHNNPLVARKRGMVHAKPPSNLVPLIPTSLGSALYHGWTGGWRKYQTLMSTCHPVSNPVRQALLSLCTVEETENQRGSWPTQGYTAWKRHSWE